ncbi:TPA: hypothetical protein RDU58_002456 [Enterococcus faecalis]|nr:hypothetical protein [Enterococcus faecalis]
MNDLEQLVSYLEGNFSNEQQFSELTETEQSEFPFAIHKSHIFNDRVLNLPENFKGIFLLEESYYTLNGKERFKSDIFLFEVNSSSNVKLSSITVPKNYANKKYEEIESIPFSEMTISEKFVPIVYKKENETFIGQSESKFTEKNHFILKQTISEKKLIIKEEIMRGNKWIFGFDKPIEYVRVKEN